MAKGGEAPDMSYNAGNPDQGNAFHWKGTQTEGQRPREVVGIPSLGSVQSAVADAALNRSFPT